jgi:hypothetical protein
VQAGGLRDLGDIVGVAEYLGGSSTISLALYNPKCEAGRMTIGFLHSFNNNFCAGAELLSEWTRNQVHNNVAIAARYVFAFAYSACLKRAAAFLHFALHDEFFNIPRAVHAT